MTISKDELITYLRSLSIDTNFIDLDFLVGYLSTNANLDFGFLLGLVGTAALRGEELDRFAKLEKLPRRKWREHDDSYGKRVRKAYLKRIKKGN